MAEINKLLTDFMEQVFEVVFEDKIRPVLEPAELLPEKDRLHRAFARWMTGQLAIFSKFYFIHDSATYQKKIIDMVLATKDGASMSLPFPLPISFYFPPYPPLPSRSLSLCPFPSLSAFFSPSY